ncbi:MAG: LysM peptidoglycan-binding domain-containing protein [Chloroflexi bacterium]|nr:LysM peptidoglycan-binding domain-containing protein [Chloroflexota bacterium]
MREKTSAGPTEIYTVQKGDHLTRIARAFAADGAMELSELVDEIYALNKDVIGDDKNILRPGQVLHIPVGSRPGVLMAATQPHPITVGAIIHLQSQLPDGGYLEARGSVADKPVITQWQNPHIRAFVATHKSKNRSKGSGSWKIISATGKPEGQPLTDGDTIYLLNMNPNVGYLDTFEWVRNLEPFKQYTTMTIGVFTSNVPRRGDGVSGIWTIRSQVGNAPSQKEIVTGDTIYLENLFPGAGYLVAHGDVAAHPMFSDYDGQHRFVFTTPLKDEDKVAYSWAITLSDQPSAKQSHTYHVWQEQEGTLVEAGAFSFMLPHNQPILSLDVQSTDKGRTFSGVANKMIAVAGEWIAAAHQYRVVASSDKNEPLFWQVGGQVAQLILERNETQARRVDGTITYPAQGAIKFKAIQALALNWQQFFEATLWESRINKISGALQAAGWELKHILAAPDGTNAAADEITFLKNQLAHMQQLQLDMVAFWQLFSQAAMKQINPLPQNGFLPPVHLIKACFQEFTRDFEIIQRAMQQRRWLDGANGESPNNAQPQSLIVTDKLAAMALTPFQHLITDSSAVIPITYFSQKIHIRRLPYVDKFVLVGITYDLSIDSLLETSLPFELMAIPHEVGHFIYHHGKLTPDKTHAYTSLAQLCASETFLNHPYHRWFEEIFADLYGCMVAGPLTALGLLALLATGDKERLLMDDDDHPTPILRPFFLSEMLRILSDRNDHWDAGATTAKPYDFSEVAKSLDANWTTMLERWGFVTEGVTDGRPARIQIPSQTQAHWEGFINVETAIVNVRKIIVAFVDVLSHAYRQREKKPLLPWCQERGGLDEYIEEIKALPRSQRLAAKKAVLLAEAREPEQRKQIITNRLPGLEENQDELSRTVFLDILKGWEDSGPHVTGGHD